MNVGVCFHIIGLFLNAQLDDLMVVICHATYETASNVREFYIYQSTWISVIEEGLLCEKEEGNLNDRYAISVLNCLAAHFPTCAFYADVGLRLRYGDRCFTSFLFPSKCTSSLAPLITF